MNLSARAMPFLVFLASAVGGPLQVSANDSVFKPIALVGWNRDVVFENAPAPAAAPFDWPDQPQPDFPIRAWFEAGLEGHADGLPAARRFTSAANPKVLFELQPYATNNVLLLTMVRPSGTLGLAEPAAYRSLVILAAGAGGNNVGNLRLHFSDGTVGNPLRFQAPDWWASYPSAGVIRTPAITGLGRSSGEQQFKYEQRQKNPDDAGFALYQTEIDLPPLGLDKKALQRISFTKGDGSVTVGILAVSGDPSKSSDSPTVELERP